MKYAPDVLQEKLVARTGGQVKFLSSEKGAVLNFIDF